tara:strand:- start:219 stop:455 length:237 start_codon:yes stop_codon:yes gene_type:complete
MLLSIPVICASLFFSLFEVYNEGIKNIYLSQSLFAALISFATALISINFMMRLIKKTNFNIFIIYRILLGIILLGFYA